LIYNLELTTFLLLGITKSPASISTTGVMAVPLFTLALAELAPLSRSAILLILKLAMVAILSQFMLTPLISSDFTRTLTSLAIGSISEALILLEKTGSTKPRA